MAMRCVDDHDVDFAVDQRFGALETLVAHSRSRRNAKPPCLILGCIGIIDGFLDVLDRDQTHTAVLIIHHQQLFNASLVQQLARLVLRSAQRNRCQIVCRHQLAHGLFRIFCKTHIAIGENACKLARGISDRNAADAVCCH